MRGVGIRRRRYFVGLRVSASLRWLLKLDRKDSKNYKKFPHETNALQAPAVLLLMLIPVIWYLVYPHLQL